MFPFFPLTPVSKLLYAPKTDRNMNTGHEVGSDAKGVTARQTIFHDSQYPSYIDLPVIPMKSFWKLITSCFFLEKE